MYYPFGLFGLSEDEIKVLKDEGLSDEEIRYEDKVHKKVMQKLIRHSSLVGYGKSNVLKETYAKLIKEAKEELAKEQNKGKNLKDE